MLTTLTRVNTILNMVCLSGIFLDTFYWIDMTYFKIGTKVQFTGYFEDGITDVGIVGRHHYKNSHRLVIRGKMTGFTKCGYEIYLSNARRFNLTRHRK